MCVTLLKDQCCYCVEKIAREQEQKQEISEVILQQSRTEEMMVCTQICRQGAFVQIMDPQGEKKKKKQLSEWRQGQIHGAYKS